MSKRLDKFTRSFQHSQIPFLLAEVLTDGTGKMVDLVCRFANAPAAALLDTGQEELTNQRFTRTFPAGALEELEPLARVAFSGSSASFSCTTALGRELTVTCYQPMYGLAACILEEVRTEESPEPDQPLTAYLPGAALVLELSRGRVRSLTFSQRLCDMTGYSRKQFLNRFSDDFSALAAPEDWPDLLQDLLDAIRENRPVTHEFRLVRRIGPPLWAELRVEQISRREGAAVLYAAVLDVDRQKRDRLRLEASLRQLESVRDQSVQLFDNIPGNTLLLRFPAEGPGRLLRINSRTEAMLGLSGPELSAALAENPAALVLPADRDALTAAVRQAQAEGTELDHAFRFRRSDSTLLWLELRARFRSHADGSTLFYAVLEDITLGKKQESELRQFREFTDLLLYGADVVTLDYDPAADTARIEYPRAAGGRDIQVTQGYLAQLKENETIHPADRKAVAAALRRMAAKPGMGTFLFRSSRMETGWRTYQATCAPIFDERGNVYRIMGKAVDVTASLAAAERFRELSSRQKRLARQSLATARLDLSANRILDAKGAGRHMTRILFGNTAEECLRGIRDNIPFPEEQARFEQQFGRDTLLQAFRRGSTHFGLPHHITVGSGVVLHARSMLELAENPDTRQVEAFFAIINTEPEHLRVRTLEALLRQEGTLALAVRPATGRCTPLLGDCPDAYAALEGPPLDQVAAALETAPRFTWTDGHRRFTFSWLDEVQDLLLVSVRE